MVKNEYGQLKKVIVGDATGARIPSIDKSLRVVNYADKPWSYVPKIGPYPEQVVEEANEDLENLIVILKKENVEIHRPIKKNLPEYYYFCPRDTVLVYKNLVIATPQPIAARRLEHLAFIGVIDLVKNKKYIDLSNEFPKEFYNEKCIQNKNVLALRDTAAAFDAANILKNNDDLFYLVSNSGNAKGAELLQQVIGDQGKVHIIKDVYSYMHIDSTLCFLRDGLMLVNPSRIKNKEKLPKILQNWDMINCPDPVDIGHYPGYCNASAWGLNVNLLSINAHTVIVEEHQKELMRVLKKHKITSIPAPMRHTRTLGGGFHCVTLDFERDD